MKKILSILAIILVLGLFSVPAMATTIEGSVKGFNCATENKFHPLGKDDPLVMVEKVFVVNTPSNGYYFVPNLDRDTMVSLLHQKIKITGRMNEN